MNNKAPLIHIISAIFLVAGTCIGAAMLALPMISAKMGFFPSLCVMLVCWTYMTYTGLLLAESSLWMKPGAHYATMCEKLIGNKSKAVSWVCYLFICYASLIAYIVEGSVLLQDFFITNLHLEMSQSLAAFIFSAGLGAIIVFGSRVVGITNLIFMAGIIGCYLFLATQGWGSVRHESLLHQNWSRLSAAVPLMLTIFSFQSIVPSITNYLQRDVKAIKLSIILGTSLALIIYVVWQAIIMGSFPVDGPYSLVAVAEQGRSPATIVKYVIQNPLVVAFTEAFSFCAILTSFLGMGLGLFDFLADGLKIKTTIWGSVTLILMIMIPSFTWAVFDPKVFLTALETTGAFGDSILNGILPVMMVWLGRYKKNLSSEHRIPGGKFALIIIFLFSCYAIFTGF